MAKLQFALIGAGFWSDYQLPGWLECGECECVAVCDADLSRAQTLAARFGICNTYSELESMLDAQPIDFLDVATPVETHSAIVHAAASRQVPVVCQKPMAQSLSQARRMVEACRAASTPLYVNENWRWQTPMRALKEVLDSGRIGEPFRARIDMISGFEVFRNQPSLARLEQFIIADLGSHTLDAARFLFGEAARLFCTTQQVHPDIRGEDVATIVLEMRNGMTVVVEMAYAENHLEHDRFPETRVFVEGNKGSVRLDLDYMIRVTTAAGTEAVRHAPTSYDWADPEYAIVHSSIVACQSNLLSALRGQCEAETTGDDNLKTVELVFAAYESADRGEAVALDPHPRS